MDAVACNDLSHAISEKTRGIEFPQPGVDERVAEACRRKPLPRCVVGGDVASVAPRVTGQKREEIPPQEFEPEPIGALVRTELSLVEYEIVCDASRRDASPGEPRGELARVIAPEQFIACLFVGVGQSPVAILLPVTNGGRRPARRDHGHIRNLDGRADHAVGKRRQSIRRGNGGGEAHSGGFDALSKRCVGARHRRGVERQVAIADHADGRRVAVADIGRRRLMQEQQVGAPCSQGRLQVCERGEEKRLLMRPPHDRRVERKHREQTLACGCGGSEQGVVVETQVPSQVQQWIAHRSGASQAGVSPAAASTAWQPGVVADARG